MIDREDLAALFPHQIAGTRVFVVWHDRFDDGSGEAEVIGVAATITEAQALAFRYGSRSGDLMISEFGINEFPSEVGN